MAVNVLQNALYQLDQIGFTDVLLPFILVYVVVFAILQKISLFGQNQSRKFNALIALATALAVIIPHSLNRYPPGTDVVTIINSFLPNVSLLLLVVLFIMIVTSFFGINWSQDSWTIRIITIASVLALIGIFVASAGWWTPYGPLSFLQDPDLQATLTIILGFALIVGVIVSEPPKQGQKTTPFIVFGNTATGQATAPANPPGGHS